MNTFRTILFTCALITPFLVSAQAPQLAPNFKMLLQQPKHPSAYQKQGNDWAPMMVKIRSVQAETELIKLGVQIGTKAGDVWTLRVPKANLYKLSSLTSLAYVQLDEPVAIQLDAARRSARVDSVHAGIQLPQAFTGKNVVVGIIDAGFDYGHPTFYDTTGRVLRVKRVWEQHNPGTPPNGYSYGNELIDTSTMIQEGAEVQSFSHGTHVGGIAAGSGFTGVDNRKYRGVAFESDLLFVGIKPDKSEWKTASMSSIIDGVNYIFNYAASVGKPAVVNLSWGCSIGPNDGTSLFAQALNNLTGAGRIFVNSAGNNGDENIHLYKNFSEVDTVVHSFVNFPVINGEKRTWLDIWGSPQQNLCVKFRLFNGATEVNAGLNVCAGSGLDTFLVDTNQDTVYLQITSELANPFNNKVHILVDAFSKSGAMLCVSMQANQGNTHAWLGYVNDYNGYYGSFTNYSRSWAVNGNAAYTLGEMSCTQSAVTVAAYTSKTSFRNIAGGNMSYAGYAALNQIAPFSSRGPTADGRIKPDIAAPGLIIASAVNSYDVSYAPNGNNYDHSVALVNYRNRNYYYGEAMGTSMSSPMAAGMIALLLQANPGLEPGRIHAIINQTAFKDNATGTRPDSSRWGAGKFNVYAAIKAALLTVGMQESVREDAITIQAFPNPAQDHLQVVAPGAGPIVLEVLDLTGRNQLLTGSATNEARLDLSGLASGVYVLHVTGQGWTTTRRIVIAHR